MLSSARLRFADVEWQKGCLGSAGKLATVFRHEPEGHRCGSRLRGRAGEDMAGDAGRKGRGAGQDASIPPWGTRSGRLYPARCLRLEATGGQEEPDI